MKLIHVLSLSIVATLSSIIAHAGTFAYSYTFNKGDALTGTFVGTKNGNLISNISDATVSFNGTSIGEITHIAGFLNPNVWGNEVEGLAVVSIDGTLNNFIFGNSTNWMTGEVVSLTYPGWGAILGVSTGMYDFDAPMNFSWSVTEISSVSDASATGAMLGVAFIGLVALRRRVKIG